MKTLEVIIQSDMRAKELNPFACYKTQEPHPMDFEDKEEFQIRFKNYKEAEKDLRTFKVEKFRTVPLEKIPVPLLIAEIGNIHTANLLDENSIEIF